jgi:hypothetical protein
MIVKGLLLKFDEDPRSKQEKREKQPFPAARESAGAPANREFCCQRGGKDV